MEGPYDLSPRDRCLCVTQGVRTEEQEEATGVIINRATMLLNHTDTFYNVGQEKLFTTGKKGKLFPLKKFIELDSNVFCHSLRQPVF